MIDSVAKHTLGFGNLSSERQRSHLVVSYGMQFCIETTIDHLLLQYHKSTTEVSELNYIKNK